MKSRTLLLALVCLAAFDAASSCAVGDEAKASAAAAFDPTSAYAPEEIAGWQVYLHRRLLKEDPELAKRVRAELQRQLKAIVEVVPPDKVEALRKSKIWIERFHPRHPCACYHPSQEWLEENGFNPEKVDSVEIANPENFLDWSARAQPWMLLHELAHAYHDQVLTHKHPGILRAFERAKRGGAYPAVKHIDGSSAEHYALSNDQEYFAETTEAYFGKNDFYPFERAELAEFDPEGFKLMKKVWAPANEETLTAKPGR